MSWVNRAARERLAKQLRREDTQYTHHWTVKDSSYAKTPTMAKDVQALANTRGQKLHRSADEPAAAPSSLRPKSTSTLRRATTTSTTPTGTKTRRLITDRATPGMGSPRPRRLRQRPEHLPVVWKDRHTGRPDLVVLDDRDATIIDIKAGQERPRRRVQVIIYQYALPLALPQYRNVRIGGKVIYPTHTVRVPREHCPNSSSRNSRP